jgi:hypothetical protein
LAARAAANAGRLATRPTWRAEQFSGFTMGIKFLCPNGHKLHVKSYLSGKKAICPKCGVRVVVPSEDGATAVTDTSDASTDDSSLLEATETQTLTAVNVAAAAAKKPAAAATPTPNSQAAADPIAESPAAVWYVRPATGGQYGPASGEIMRGWLQDGRVGASSLVWRAGWSEWRSAAEIFPQLGSKLAAPAPATAGLALPTAATSTLDIPKGRMAELLPAAAPEATGTGSVSPLTRAAIKRRKRSDRTFFATAGLLVVSVVLLIVLMFVFRARLATPEAQPPAGPAKNAAAPPAA